LKLDRKGISTSYEELIDMLRGIHVISIKMPGSKNEALQLDYPETVAPELIPVFKLKTAIRLKPICSP